jgi:uncharacterized damage-inducible protein DinB
MDLSSWFNYQLKASSEGFIWAVAQVPVERREIEPPAVFGEWTVARHIFHLLYYERIAALPHMLHWLGEPLPSFEERDEQIAWQQESSKGIEQLLSEFQQVRADEIALLPHFNEQLWKQERSCLWGNETMQWIVTKTYQHTMDHANTILQMALFWE